MISASKTPNGRPVLALNNISFEACAYLHTITANEGIFVQLPDMLIFIPHGQVLLQSFDVCGHAVEDIRKDLQCI